MIKVSSERVPDTTCKVSLSPPEATIMLTLKAKDANILVQWILNRNGKLILKPKQKIWPELAIIQKMYQDQTHKH